MADVTKFEQAIDEAGWGLWAFYKDSVTETHETIEHFIAARGKAEVVDTENGCTLFIWQNVQQRKGLRRGVLIVMDAGDTRLVHFDGETR